MKRIKLSLVYHFRSLCFFTAVEDIVILRISDTSLTLQQ